MNNLKKLFLALMAVGIFASPNLEAMKRDKPDSVEEQQDDGQPGPENDQMDQGQQVDHESGEGEAGDAEPASPAKRARLNLPCGFYFQGGCLSQYNPQRLTQVENQVNRLIQYDPATGVINLNPRNPQHLANVQRAFELLNRIRYGIDSNAPYKPWLVSRPFYFASTYSSFCQRQYQLMTNFHTVVTLSAQTLSLPAPQPQPAPPARRAQARAITTTTPPCLDHILNFLPPEQLPQVARVNRQWRDAALNQRVENFIQEINRMIQYDPEENRLDLDDQNAEDIERALMAHLTINLIHQNHHFLCRFLTQTNTNIPNFMHRQFALLTQFLERIRTHCLADPNFSQQVQSCRDQVLAKTIDKNDLAAVKELLTNYHANPDSRIGNLTPATQAFLKGKLGITKELLERGGQTTSVSQVLRGIGITQRRIFGGVFILYLFKLLPKTLINIIDLPYNLTSQVFYYPIIITMLYKMIQCARQNGIGLTILSTPIIFLDSLWFFLFWLPYELAKSTISCGLLYPATRALHFAEEHNYFLRPLLRLVCREDQEAAPDEEDPEVAEEHHDEDGHATAVDEMEVDGTDE